MKHKEAIDKIIKMLGIKDCLALKSDYDYGFFVGHGTIGKDRTLIKIFSKTIKKKSEGLSKEGKVGKFLKESNIDIPEVVAYGEDKNYVWLVRSFYPGFSLSSFSPGEPLYGYDRLNTNIRHQSIQIIEEIVANINKLRNVNVASIKYSNRFNANIYDYPISDIEKGLNIDLSKQTKFFSNLSAMYFNKANMCPSTGDLNPSNILILENGNIMFTDLEWFSLDNKLVDASFLWLFFWRERNWQKQLIKELSLNPDEQNFFRASIIRQIIGLYRFTYDKKLKNDKPRAYRKVFFKDHIWTKYLIAAGDSFESILKIKK